MDEDVPLHGAEDITKEWYEEKLISIHDVATT